MPDLDPWEDAAAAPSPATGKDPWETAEGAAPVSDAAAPKPNTTTALGQFGRGVADPAYGGMQAAAHLADSPIAGMIPGVGAAKAIVNTAAGSFFGTSVTKAAKDYADRAVKEREEKIAKERGDDASKTDWWRMGGNVAASLPMGAGGLLEGAGSGLLGMVGRGAATGALAGALEPVKEGDNFGTTKAAQIGEGGVLGGGIGILGKGASEGAKMAGEYVLRTHPEAAENAAVQTILKRWGQDTKHGAGSATDALDLINATNKPMALADKAGSNVRALGGSVARTPGESQQVAKQFLNERNTEAATRLNQDIDTYVHSGASAYKTVQTLLRSRSAAAAPLYNDARALDHVWSPRLDEFFANPRIQEGLNRGFALERDFALAEGRPMSTTQLGIDLDMEGNVKLVDKPNLMLLDMAKRGLDATIADSRDQYGRLTAEGLAASKIKNAFVSEIDSLDKNGIYKKARETWGGYSASKDAVELGGKLMSENRSLAENEELIASLTDGDKQFLRLGLADNLRSRLDKITDITGDLKTATPLLTSSEIMKRIRPAFRSKEEADAFIKAVADEHAMASSRKGYLGGSQSIERGMEEATNAMESVGKAKDFLTGGLFKKAAMAWDLYSKIGQAPPAKIREEIAKILFTSDIQPASRIGQKLQGKLPTAQPNPNQAVADRITQVAPTLGAPAQEVAPGP